MAGAIKRQGPHHVATNSTRTGRLDFKTTSENSVSLISCTPPHVIFILKFDEEDNNVFILLHLLLLPLNGVEFGFEKRGLPLKEEEAEKAKGFTAVRMGGSGKTLCAALQNDVDSMVTGELDGAGEPGFIK